MVPVLVAVDELFPVPAASLVLDSHLGLPQERQLVQLLTLEKQKVSDLIEEQPYPSAAVTQLRDPVYPPRGNSLYRNHGAKECV